METSLTITVDDARVVFDRTAPAARSVIFVHGGFGSSSELWHLPMSTLPEGVAGYALNNFLRSDPPASGYSVSSFADRLAHFADALNLEAPVIIGHSMGGVVCQIAASRYPDRFGGLVLVGTGPNMQSHGVGQALLDRLRNEGLSRQLMQDISANWFYQDPPEGFFEEYVERALTAPLQAMIDVQASLLEANLLPDLGRIRCPTLIVHGAHDVGRPLQHAERLKNGISGSRLHICEQSGHSPMLETPEEFDAVFHDFLHSINPSLSQSDSEVHSERN